MTRRRRQEVDYDDEDFEDEDYDDDDYVEDRRFRRRRDIGDDAGMRMLLPVGRSGWAVAAGYLGLLSLVLIPAPFALATGIVAVREMRRNPKKHGMGRAIFGIIMGSLGSLMLLFVLVGVLATFLSHK